MGIVGEIELFVPFTCPVHKIIKSCQEYKKRKEEMSYGVD